VVGVVAALIFIVVAAVVIWIMSLDGASGPLRLPSGPGKRPSTRDTMSLPRTVPGEQLAAGSGPGQCRADLRRV
jgi:hypothetical protein